MGIGRTRNAKRGEFDATGIESSGEVGGVDADPLPVGLAGAVRANESPGFEHMIDGAGDDHVSAGIGDGGELGDGQRGGLRLGAIAEARADGVPGQGTIAS